MPRIQITKADTRKKRIEVTREISDDMQFLQTFSYKKIYVNGKIKVIYA